MRFLQGFALGLIVMGLLSILPARSHNVQRPAIPAPVFKAVRTYWQTRPERIQAFNVAWCESKFRVRAVSPTGDYGFMQINRQAHSNWVDFKRIFNPFYSAYVAHRMYVDGGWQPWYPSRSCWA
jgi:hypothetical protein